MIPFQIISNVRDYRLQENLERERRIEANLTEMKEVKKQIDISNSILEENLSKIEIPFIQHNRVL
jgi:hypothetical protein